MCFCRPPNCNYKLFHPSIFIPAYFYYRLLEPIPAVIEQEAGYTPTGGKSIAGPHREINNHTHRINLESPLNLTCMFFNSGRKLEYPERTHTCMGRTSKLLTERSQPGFEPRTLLWRGNSANHHTTMQPNYKPAYEHNIGSSKSHTR